VRGAGVDLDGEVFARIEELDEEGKAALRRELVGRDEVVAPELDGVVERAAGEGTVGDDAALRAAARARGAGRAQVGDFPGFADELAGRQLFAEALQAPAAPDLFQK